MVKIITHRQALLQIQIHPSLPVPSIKFTKLCIHSTGRFCLFYQHLNKYPWPQPSWKTPSCYSIKSLQSWFQTNLTKLHSCYWEIQNTRNANQSHEIFNHSGHSCCYVLSFWYATFTLDIPSVSKSRIQSPSSSRNAFTAQFCSEKEVFHPTTMVDPVSRSRMVGGRCQSTMYTP